MTPSPLKRYGQPRSARLQSRPASNASESSTRRVRDILTYSRWLSYRTPLRSYEGKAIRSYERKDLRSYEGKPLGSYKGKALRRYDTAVWRHPCPALVTTASLQRFRGGLVFKSYILLYHSALGLRVIKKKKKAQLPKSPSWPAVWRHPNAALVKTASFCTPARSANVNSLQMSTRNDGAPHSARARHVRAVLSPFCEMTSA